MAVSIFILPCPPFLSVLMILSFSKAPPSALKLNWNQMLPQCCLSPPPSATEKSSALHIFLRTHAALSPLSVIHYFDGCSITLFLQTMRNRRLLLLLITEVIRSIMQVRANNGWFYFKFCWLFCHIWVEWTFGPAVRIRGHNVMATTEVFPECTCWNISVMDVFVITQCKLLSVTVQCWHYDWQSWTFSFSTHTAEALLDIFTTCLLLLCCMVVRTFTWIAS